MRARRCRNDWTACVRGRRRRLAYGRRCGTVSCAPQRPKGKRLPLWEWLLSQSSLVRPLRAFLVDSDVHFIRQTVTDLEFEEGEETAVTALYTTDGRREEMVQLHEGDLCFFSPGQGDCAAWADAARLPGSAPACPDAAVLWQRIAARRPGLGNPEAFLPCRRRRSARFCSYTAFAYHAGSLNVWRRRMRS